MKGLLEVLMSRDELSQEEASDLIEDMRDRIYYDGENPEEVLHEEGLEPDYVFDLLSSTP